MIIFNKITKTEAYVELTTENGEKHIIPTSDVIFVNDESGFVSIKNTGSRKTIGLISEEDYDGGDEPIPYDKQYLTLETLEDGVLTFPNSMENTAYYSIDNGEWELLTSASTVNIEGGHKVRLKGGQMIPHDIVVNYNHFNMLCTIRFSSSHNVFGNVASLYYGDNFVNVNAQTEFAPLFGCLFYNDQKLISAENLILPWVKMDDKCYRAMFFGCTSLTTVPSVLPATTLANECYRAMFFGCTSLTTVPSVLPATTLVNGCYQEMFSGCTSLTTAPELPATTLASWCYNSMFQGCASLTTAPQLLATTLAQYCYSWMFQGCTSLNYIKAMFTTTPTNLYTSNWVNGVASSGTFVKNAAATWNVTGTSGVPNGWTVETASE